MKIIKAIKDHAKQISALMLSDLKKPNINFPPEMIDKLRDHAKEKNIITEFENPNLIAFVAINEEKISGFIVGYKDSFNKSSMIHYITAEKNEIKKELLDRFVEECKLKKITKIITDTFEFMNNNTFFKSNGFKLIKKEKIIGNLEMLWYELKLI